MPEAQALIGRRVRAKRRGGWQIEGGVVLKSHHTGTVIGISGDYIHSIEQPRVVIAVQIWPPAKKRRRTPPRDFLLRLEGKVIARIPPDGADPLPSVLLLDKATFESYLTLIP